MCRGGPDAGRSSPQGWLCREHLGAHPAPLLSVWVALSRALASGPDPTSTPTQGCVGPELPWTFLLSWNRNFGGLKTRSSKGGVFPCEKWRHVLL